MPLHTDARRHHASATALAVLLLSILFPASSLACGTCGCTLNADWSSQGYTVGPGLRLDLRYDDYRQTELRSGTGKAPAAVTALPSADEIQHLTTNAITTLGIDYSPSFAWGVDMQLPWVHRFHDTWAPGDTDLSATTVDAPGDLRVVARYQGYAAHTRGGVQFGLKLPTGATDAVFHSGPAAGEKLDPGLQAGTGTTDLIVGAYRYGTFMRDGDEEHRDTAGNDARYAAGWFAHVQFQYATDTVDGYRPGNALNAGLGLRLLGTTRVVPQVQLNYRVEGRDGGANADVDNSGSRMLFLSPGVDLRVNSRLGAFAFVQVPLYRQVDGLQLEPELLFSAGLHYRL